MNFEFREKDIVVLKDRPELEMELVKEFVRGVFHAKRPDGKILRVRSAQLVRVRRPSDEAERAAIDERKAQKAQELKLRADRVERNTEEFAHLAEYRIRLTADGLPDQRQKPKYTAKNSPERIRRKPRGELI